MGKVGCWILWLAAVCWGLPGVYGVAFEGSGLGVASGEDYGEG